MREARLIHDGSVCQGDFIDGIETVNQLRVVNTQNCRFFPVDCPVHRSEGPYCIAKAGQQVARYVTELGTSIEAELEDFNREAPMPAKGYFDPTIEDPADATTDRTEVVARVGKWAEKVLGVNPLDAASYHREYRASNDPNFPVVKESVRDEETCTWMHKCGTLLAAVTVSHPIHTRALPLAGSGGVRSEQVPFCPSCQEAPNTSGTPWYAEDIEADEERHLRRLRENG